MRIKLPILANSFVGLLAVVLVAGCGAIDTNAIDYDGDGVPDAVDAFPADPDEHTDSDGDGVGDRSDAFPADPSRSDAPDSLVTDDDTNANVNDNANENDNENDNGADDTIPDVPQPPNGGRR